MVLLLWLQILWLVVDLTTVIPCLGVSLLLICVSCNVPKTDLLELLQYYQILTLIRKKSPLKISLLLDIALLVYSVQHIGYPKYFEAKINSMLFNKPGKLTGNINYTTDLELSVISLAALFKILGVYFN